MKNTILVLSTWINHPETLPYHKKLWTEVFGEDTQYVAYIDAKLHSDFSNFGSSSMREQLINICKANAIEYRVVDQELHTQRSKVMGRSCTKESEQNPSARDSLVCQLAWNEYCIDNSEYNRVVLVQSDIFPYRKLKWSDVLKGGSFYFKPQRRDALYYGWEGLCLFDMTNWPKTNRELVSFEWGAFRGSFGDTGAGLCELLDVLPERERREWDGLNSLQWSSKDSMPELPFWIVEHLQSDPRNTWDSNGDAWYYSEIQDNWCFHLRAGGNWDNAGKLVHDTRYSRFLQLLGDAIEDGTAFL